MSASQNVTKQTYSGSFLSGHMLSGADVTLLLSNVSAPSETSATDNDGTMDVGDTVALGDGRNVTVLGSGTVTPGGEVLGIVVPLGETKPFVLAEEADGTMILIYPEGPPNLVSAAAIVQRSTPTSYTMTATCYAADTRILTAQGWLPAAAILPGMRVQTADYGLQEVIWARARDVCLTGSRADKLQPVVIRAGARPWAAAARPARLAAAPPAGRVAPAAAHARRPRNAGRRPVPAGHAGDRDRPERGLGPLRAFHDRSASADLCRRGPLGDDVRRARGAQDPCSSGSGAAAEPGSGRRSGPPHSAGPQRLAFRPAQHGKTDAARAGTARRPAGPLPEGRAQPHVHGM